LKSPKLFAKGPILTKNAIIITKKLVIINEIEFSYFCALMSPTTSREEFYNSLSDALLES